MATLQAKACTTIVTTLPARRLEHPPSFVTMARMPRLAHVVVIAYILLTFAPSTSIAQETTRPATAPVTAPATAPAAALTATITAVEGIVQVRADEQSPWQAAKPDMRLGEGAEFRTGPRSAVRFEIPPGQTITLDRLGTVKLIEAVRSQGSVKTDLGMRYGRVRYDIE